MSTWDSSLEIRIDTLEDAEVQGLILSHLKDMKNGYPEESVHTLVLEELKKPEITFWTLWSKNELAGCGALKEINHTHGEIKSMRTHESFLRKGIAQRILEHLISVAQQRGYKRLSLETGAGEAFIPAHKLYEKLGFFKCGPFDGYIEDPSSVYMSREL
ncbi:MAG: GNAT family N-acetyltransferase [Spirochaetales bacterium]|nr:GNAT family N-acetyltransferase [Spirochaetales bacterium]